MTIKSMKFRGFGFYYLRSIEWGNNRKVFFFNFHLRKFLLIKLKLDRGGGN